MFTIIVLKCLKNLLKEIVQNSREINSRFEMNCLGLTTLETKVEFI